MALIRLMPHTQLTSSTLSLYVSSNSANLHDRYAVMYVLYSGRMVYGTVHGTALYHYLVANFSSTSFAAWIHLKLQSVCSSSEVDGSSAAKLDRTQFCEPDHSKSWSGALDTTPLGPYQDLGKSPLISCCVSSHQNLLPIGASSACCIRWNNYRSVFPFLFPQRSFGMLAQ